MYTSILLAALTSLAPMAESVQAPVWHQDYVGARTQAAQSKKPLAIFLAPGKEGWNTLGRNGGLTEEAKRLLGTNYTCVHVDTATERGLQLAKQFELPEGQGIVFSDGRAQLQAFWHKGDLADQDLVRYLKRFADPERVVQYTQTNPESPSGPAPAAQGAPLFWPGYCPSCNGGCPGGRCPQ